MTRRLLCTDCHKVKHERYFKPAHPDFPTRHGRNYCCRACSKGKPKYRLADSAGQFRKLEIRE